MGKKKHTSESDRHAAAEDEGRLREHLERAGTGAVHTVNSLAELLFGRDESLQPRHRKAARRWIEKLRKLRYPLFPCDESGTMLSNGDANNRARRGIERCWRYFPDGRWVNDFGDSLDAEGRAALADGLVALEESESPEIFYEPRSRILDGIRSILSFDEYRDAKDRFAKARVAIMVRHRESLANQLSRTTMPERSENAPPQHLGFPSAARGMMQFVRRQA